MLLYHSEKAMSDLTNFLALPEEGFVTVREENGEMVSVPKSDVDEVQLPQVVFKENLIFLPNQ